jgi:hypothetical protein
MRGCLSVLVLAAAFVLGLAWFGAPALAGSIIERSLAAAGFVGVDTSVTVTSEPPLELLTGHADRVVIKARNATLRDMRAASLSLTLSNVELVDRTFARVDGILDDVSIDASDGTVLRASSLGVRGPADAATATIRLSKDVVTRLITDGIRAQAGIRVGGITLSPPDRIRFTAGLSIDGRFDVGSDGSLGVVTSGGGSRFTLFQPPPQLRLQSVSIVDSDVVLVGTISLADLVD